MTTCWYSKSTPPRPTTRWLSAFLVVLIALVALAGCQHATEEGSEAETATAPLFQEFERYYDPPEMSNYDIGDGVRVLNPEREERLPLVFEEDVRMLSDEVQRRAHITQSVIRIPNDEFEGLDELAVGDILVTGFGRDDIWSRVTAVEHFDDATVLHTVQAELDDVVFLAEFILEVEGDSPFPEGFNLLDVYLNPEPGVSDIQSVHQGLTGGTACIHDIAEEIINDKPEKLYDDIRKVFVESGFDTHKEWLINRRNHYANQVEDFDPEPFDAAINEEVCEATENFSSAIANQRRLNWDTNPNLSNPPAYQCMSYWMIDFLRQQANAFAEEGDETLNDQQVCDALNTDEPDEDDVINDVEKDGGSLGGAMSEGMGAGFTLPIPGGNDPDGGFSANVDEILRDQCLEMCEVNAPEGEVQECQDGCPTFGACAFDTFCFQLTDLSVSYKPKFVLRFRIGLTGARLKIGIEGPLTFTIGAELSAEYSFNWERSKQFSFPIPKLGFSLGPLKVGFHVYAEFGISFSFDAKAVIHAVYTLIIDTEAGIEIGVPGRTGPYGGFSKNDESGLDLNASGEISAEFNAWAGGGIGFFLGIDTSSIDDYIPDLIKDKIELPGGKILWLDPIRALLTVGATLAPPMNCTAHASARVFGEMGYHLNFGIFSIGEDTYKLWEYVFFDEVWQLQEFIPPLKYICDPQHINFEEPVFEGDRTVCNDDNDCEDGESCGRGGTCMVDNDLRFILEWGPHVKLSLMIIDPNGQRYSLFIGDDSIFTRWDDPVEEPSSFGYFEIAGIDNPTPGTYRFYVVPNPNYETTESATSIGYSVTVEHNERSETVQSNVDLTAQESPVTFEYTVE